jgi:hypothetical protein
MSIILYKSESLIYVAIATMFATIISACFTMNIALNNYCSCCCDNFICQSGATLLFYTSYYY